MKTALYKVEILPGLYVDVRGEGAYGWEAHHDAALKIHDIWTRIRSQYEAALETSQALLLDGDNDEDEDCEP